MIPSCLANSTGPWSIAPEKLRDCLAAIGAAASRPPKKPVYKYSEEEGYDMAEDWSLAAQSNEARLMIQKVSPTMAVLQVRGMILKDCPFYYWAYGLATSLTHLDLALNMVADGGFKHVVIDFNSPGGSVIGLYETASTLRDLRVRGIHATAYTSNQCCSAAYYLASACQEIISAPTAIVGSIGTYSAFLDTSKALETEGLKVELFVARQAPLKGAGITGSLTDEQREDMQRHVNEADALFQAQLKASRRGMNLEEASTGAWWFAKSAPRGLVDDASVFLSLNDLISTLGA